MAIDLTPTGVPGSSYDDFGLKSNNATVVLTGLVANANRGDLHVKRVIPAYSDLSTHGAPGGLYSFSNQITVELVGIQGNADVSVQSALIVTGDALETLTSQLGQTSLGSITAAVPGVQALTGQVGTTSLGSLTPAFDWTEVVIGVEGTGQIGEPIFGINLDTLLATTSLGSLTVTTEQILTLGGQELTSSLGPITQIHDSVVPITASTATSGLGSLTVSVPAVVRDVYSDLSLSGTPGHIYTFAIQAPAVVLIDGVEATGAVALFDANATTQGVDGSLGTGAAATLNTAADTTELMSAVVGTTTLGGLILPNTVVLEGQFSTALLGNIGVQSDDVSQVLNGQIGTASLGTIAANTDAVITMPGVEGDGIVGDAVFATVSIIVPIPAVSARAQAGELFDLGASNIFPFYVRVTMDDEPLFAVASIFPAVGKQSLIVSEPEYSRV